MKSVLEELFYGNIDPSEIFYPKSKEYKEVSRKYCDDVEEFYKKLDPFLKESFNIVNGEFGDVLNYENLEIFLGGFRLGARIMLEVMDDSWIRN